MQEDGFAQAVPAHHAAARLSPTRSRTATSRRSLLTFGVVGAVGTAVGLAIARTRDDRHEAHNEASRDADKLRYAETDHIRSYYRLAGL